MRRALITAAVIATLNAQSAGAVDFSQMIVDFDGKAACMEAVREGECPADKIATLGRISRLALNAIFPDEKDLSPEEKYKRGEIAQALVGDSNIKLKSEQTALIKKLIGKLYPPAVVFSAWNMLEDK